MLVHRFNALLDANVLAPALSRNMLLSLAEAEFFRPRWSDRIMDETEKAIESMLRGKGVADPAGDAKRARVGMTSAFEDATVEDFDTIEAGLSNLPDMNDAHVIAAAIQTGASVIVTDNIKDFPASVLVRYGMEARSADDFLADSIDLQPEKAALAIATMRGRFKNPAMSTEHLLTTIETRGLTDTANLLRPYSDLL